MIQTISDNHLEGTALRPLQHLTMNRTRFHPQAFVKKTPWGKD